jgi:asparagine synthase (glutamine-hydrolysing)
VCGIAGVVAAPGAHVDRDALHQLVAALTHRGPDDSGVEVVGNVGLAHTRLSIVEPSPAGHQPMVGPGGRWWLTYNGEVFNHLQLRADLPDVGYRGGSDTETLLHALHAWGQAAVPRCNGLFAFAALDTAAGALFLVRDRFGVKPLYYALHAGALWFASEMRALLAAGVPREPDMEVLRHAVLAGWANGERTPLAAIRLLPAGSLLRVDTRTLSTELRRWYHPTDVVDLDQIRARRSWTAADAAAAVEQVLDESVRRRLMADVPVGTMCSGGVDSSLITLLAARHHPGIHAYNARLLDQPAADESEWAKLVADHIGVPLHTVDTTAESWRADLVDVVQHIEYPLTHESSVPMSHIASLARHDGVKVLLSGEGADELFGGYGWLHADAYEGFRHRRRRVERLTAVPNALFWRAKGPAAPESRPGPSARIRDVEEGEERRFSAAYRRQFGARRRLSAALGADLCTYLPHLLNRQDKSTMRESIETRVPFLDPAVVATALNLPLELRVLPERKAPLRDLSRRLLPPGVADRPKVGFGFDVRGYLAAARPSFLADGRLRDLLRVGADEWAGRVAAADSFHSLLLWTGEIWCRLFVDGATVTAVDRELW